MDKGTDYELKVMKLVKLKLEEDEFGINPKQARVSHKPTYYSRDRQKDIIFDVSIEICRKGAETPYWIWIWECKNYSHKVPVDDVEEFHAKLNQVGANRTKGTIITPIGFDEGACEFARSKGIGLWRWIPDGTPIIRLDAGSDSWSYDAVWHGITHEITSGLSGDDFVFALTTNGQSTTVFSEMIAQEFLDM
ncbi:restriction endonuclease [Nodosilinea sp. LEGE 06152]|uniref:restriction endonuclease n=1 Tax=Nodosilinea sp. LEGE 06152 TaxID=2777966 RepID=UPI0018820552|nr:restriction endonuclease [Nodosilinea sp. LEGE 06152]MBE9156991.1 restriction endonuclease [Nodosilinea sp. LEGE 06152]